MDQNVANLLTDAFSDFEHLNFEDYADESFLASRALETEQKHNNQEQTRAPRQGKHNTHTTSTGKETYVQDTDSETDDEITPLEDTKMSEEEKCPRDCCDIERPDENETRNLAEGQFAFDGDQAGVDQSNGGESERCSDVENKEVGSVVPFLDLRRPDNVDDTCSYSLSDSGSEDAEATGPQHLVVDREAMNELCLAENMAGLNRDHSGGQDLSSLMQTAQAAHSQAEEGDLREFSEDDHACVGEDFAEYPTELTDSEEGDGNDDDDDGGEGDDDDDGGGDDDDDGDGDDDGDDDYDGKEESDTTAPLHSTKCIGFDYKQDTRQEGEYGEEEEDQEEEYKEEEEEVIVEADDDDDGDDDDDDGDDDDDEEEDTVEDRPKHAIPHDCTKTYRESSSSSDESNEERPATTTSHSLSRDHSSLLYENEFENPSMQHHRHDDDLTQIQDILTEEGDISHLTTQGEIPDEGIDEDERPGGEEGADKQDVGVDVLPDDYEHECPVSSHHDSWGIWRKEFDSYMLSTNLNLDVNIDELGSLDSDISFSNIRDRSAVAQADESSLQGRTNTNAWDSAWSSETLLDEAKQPLRISRQEFVVVEQDVTSDSDFSFDTSLEQDSHATDEYLGGCLLSEDTEQEGMEDNTYDSFGEEERSWDQERERIEAFNRFYNDSDESCIEGKEERIHKVHFCLEPQIVEVLDSESESSDMETEEDSERDSDLEDMQDEEQSETEEPQGNLFSHHDLAEPTESVFPPHDQEEQTENTFFSQDQDQTFQEKQPMFDDVTADQLMKTQIPDRPMEKQLTDQPVEEEDTTLHTTDKQQIATRSQTTSKRQKCSKILKSALKMCVVIATGLLTFWWATDHLDWTRW